MIGKPKRGNWSFKEQRQLMELAAASQSLETISDRLGRPPATILRKAARLGLAIKGQNAKEK